MIRTISLKDGEEIERIKTRGLDVGGFNDKVRKIVEDVRNGGDKALLEYTERFDKLNVEKMKVSQDEIKSAYSEVKEEVVEALKRAAENVRKYHEMQLPQEWMAEISEGVRAGQIIRPLDSVGCYVPGGNYPLLSTVVMTVIPAKVAGVPEIIICSPPDIDPAVLVAADICGADAVFRAGGAQAIAAMAYGTESIPRVCKIVGPGNVYVTSAKKLVYGECGIDFIAGPSELMIIADSKGNEKYIAADMLSQAEHDEMASAVLVTDSKELALKVDEVLEKQLEELETKEIALKSISDYGAIVLVDNVDEAFDFANEFAPEHLEIMIDDEGLLQKVRNAGAVFIGEYSAEAAGDYCTGTNHVLPTNQFSRVRAGLSVHDFLKMPSVQRLTKEGLMNLKRSIMELAEAEGLYAHKKSVEIR